MLVCRVDMHLGHFIKFLTLTGNPLDVLIVKLNGIVCAVVLDIYLCAISNLTVPIHTLWFALPACITFRFHSTAKSRCKLYVIKWATKTCFILMPPWMLEGATYWEFKLNFSFFMFKWPSWCAKICKCNYVFQSCNCCYCIETYRLWIWNVMTAVSVINGFISSAHTTPGLLDIVMMVY